MATAIPSCPEVPEDMDTFDLFNSFPPEIHSLILASCPPNDFICLRLTSKYLYSLSQSLLASKSRIPLTNTDLGLLCGQIPRDPSLPPENRWSHRYKCHALSHAAVNKSYEEAGLVAPELQKCRTRGWTEHCECFSRKFRLHHRLRNWVPRGLNYCGTCEKFTRRKRGHNGRCYHGRPKVRKFEGNYWTHSSRKGAFGPKLWKKWFSNAAMNKYESRLSQETTRNENKRYGLRKLEPQAVDTREVRDNHSTQYM